jgi:hypothetical protein
MKVPATSENVMKCICCKTCPTFKHTLCTGWAHCATGKSEETPEQLGCDCCASTAGSAIGVLVLLALNHLSGSSFTI